MELVLRCGIGNKGMTLRGNWIEIEPQYEPVSGFVQNNSLGERRLHTGQALRDWSVLYV